MPHSARGPACVDEGPGGRSRGALVPKKATALQAAEGLAPACPGVLGLLFGRVPEVLGRSVGAADQNTRYLITFATLSLIINKRGDISGSRQQCCMRLGRVNRPTSERGTYPEPCTYAIHR